MQDSVLQALLVKHVIKPNYSNYELKLKFSEDEVEAKLIGYVYSDQFEDVNSVIAASLPASLPSHILEEIVSKAEVLPTTSLNWQYLHGCYNIEELRAKKIIEAVKTHQIGEEDHPLSCLAMWSPKDWQLSDAEKILRRRAVQMSQDWGSNCNIEEAIVTMTQTLMEEGLCEELVSENVEVAVIRGLRDKLHGLNPQREGHRLNALMWYHVLLMKTAGKNRWTMQRDCGATQVIPYHPILLEAVQHRVIVNPVLEGEHLEVETCVNEIAGAQGWREITLLEFLSGALGKNYQDPSSTTTIPVITTPQQLHSFKEPTERDEEVDDVFTNGRNETYILSNGDLRKLYSLRPAGVDSMMFVEFVVDYYRKQSGQETVIDANTGLGEESGHNIIGVDVKAPLSMQLSNMIIMKRRTRLSRPVPLLLSTDGLDNYGEQVLFQPWRSLEELNYFRTEEEELERKRRRLEFFPMAAFPSLADPL